MNADPLNRSRRPRIARHSRRMRLQRPQYAGDDLGGRQTTWVTIATLWAAVEPQAGFAAGDAVRLDQTAARARARVWLRQPLGQPPRPGMRFEDVADGTRWRIEAVTDADGGRHHLVCLCSAEPL